MFNMAPSRGVANGGANQMTKKEAEAIERAIMVAASTAVGAAIADYKGQIPKDWSNDEIRRKIREELESVTDKR